MQADKYLEALLGIKLDDSRFTDLSKNLIMYAAGDIDSANHIIYHVELTVDNMNYVIRHMLKLKYVVEYNNDSSIPYLTVNKSK